MDQIRMWGAEVAVVVTMNLVSAYHDGLGLANVTMEEIRMGMTAVQT